MRYVNVMTAISPFGREEAGIRVSSRKYPKLSAVLVLEDNEFATLLNSEEAVVCVPITQPRGLKKDVLVKVEGRTEKLAAYQGHRYQVIAHILDVVPGRRPARPTTSLRFAQFELANPPAGGTEMVA
ncbi:MAG TPA: hypothetical protein VI999_04545 [Thermoplasmata archaeon]|nr:hypothetical protein [Thermoplasmata archaeon]